MASQRDTFLIQLEEARNTIVGSFREQELERGERSSTAPRLSRGLAGITRGINQLLDSSTATLNAPAASSSRTIPLGETASTDVQPDELPGYHRTDPSLLSSRTYSYSNKSGKVEATVIGAGQNPRYPVFIKDVYETVSGKVTIRLDKPEAISSLKIRLKAVVSTSIVVARGTNRQPIMDEVQLLDEGGVLWEAPSDDVRVHGIKEFPYKIQIPPVLRNGTISPHPIPLPPSFVLSSRSAHPLETASVRYYLKITLARQGLLRPNDRLLIPIAYIKHQKSTLGTRERVMAHLERRVLPSPAEDPDGFAGRNIRQECSRGMFGGKKAWYEVVGLLPTPAVFDRHSPLPVHIKVTSTDTAITSVFPSGSVNVFLVQFSTITARGATAVLENPVATGTLQTINGGEGSLEQTENGRIWTKRLFAQIEVPILPPSFSGPNIKLDYAVSVRLTPSGIISTTLHVPIRLISTPNPLPPVVPTTGLASVDAPPPPHPSASAFQQPAPAPSQPPATLTEADLAAQLDEAPDLPPSYWEAIQDDGNREPAGRRRTITSSG